MSNYRERSEGKKHKRPFKRNSHHDDYKNNSENRFRQEENRLTSNLDNKTRNYILSLKETIETVDFNSEDGSILMDNVFDEIQGKILDVTVESQTAPIFETLIRQMNTKQLLTICGSFKIDDLQKLCVHGTGSRVIEYLLTLIPIHYEKSVALQEYQQNNDTDDESINNFTQFVERLTNNILNTIGLNSMCKDRNGTHVLRTLLFTLKGYSNANNNSNNYYNNNNNNKQNEFNITEETPVYVIPDNFSEYLVNIKNEFLKLDINNLIQDTYASAVLQVFIKVLPNVTQFICDAFHLNLNDFMNKNNKIQKSITDRVASHFIQILVQVSDKQLYSYLYTVYLRNNLNEYAKDNYGNWVIQECINKIYDAPQCTLIVDELYNEIPSLLFKGRSGVVSKLVQAVLKFKVKQKEIVKIITESVKQQETSICVGLLELKQFKQTSNYSAVGCILLESLFHFSYDIAKPILESFASLETNYLLKLSCDKMGSRVVESFLTTEFVKKQQFIDKYQGNYVKLSYNPFGAHVVESCFKSADITRKEKIATELLPVHQELLGDNNGKFVILNCKILQFNSKKETWLQNELQNQRKRKMFEDILEQEQQPTTVIAEKKHKKHKILDEVDQLFKDAKEQRLAGKTAPAVIETKKEKKRKTKKEKLQNKDNNDNEESKEESTNEIKTQQVDHSLDFMLKSLEKAKK